MRESLGVWLKDRWRYELALRSKDYSYLSLANRTERLQPAPDGIGFACLWQYTSRLHAPLLQPRLGQRLLRRCLVDAPIVRSAYPTHGMAVPSSAQNAPQISVLIGHRGLQRLPLLTATLESFAAQRHVSFECLVIEQDDHPHIQQSLHAWIRYIHDPPVSPGAAYNRSQAFNTGARHARAPVLLLHDNDMLVPSDYLHRILARVAQGYQALNTKRYVFYLSSDHTPHVLASSATLDDQPFDSIVQNLEAGGSMAICREAYWQIGGMDESFVGWGGEDNEFWDRCQTLPCWVWGYEPIVHLWHPSQPLKDEINNPNLSLYRAKMNLPAWQRIEQLIALCRS